MSNHTPGPWNVSDDDFSVVKPHPSAPKSKVGYIIAKSLYSFDVETREPTEETKANTRLIAAAPDLLAACELAEATIIRFDKHGSAVGTLDVIRMAITKAKGE